MESRSTMIDHHIDSRRRPVGKLPTYKQTVKALLCMFFKRCICTQTNFRERETQALERMAENSRHLPPPVDDVRYWRPKDRQYVVYGDGTRELLADRSDEMAIRR